MRLLSSPRGHICIALIAPRWGAGQQGESGNFMCVCVCGKSVWECVRPDSSASSGLGRRSLPSRNRRGPSTQGIALFERFCPFCFPPSMSLAFSSRSLVKSHVPGNRGCNIRHSCSPAASGIPGDFEYPLMPAEMRDKLYKVDTYCSLVSTALGLIGRYPSRPSRDSTNWKLRESPTPISALSLSIRFAIVSVHRMIGI